MAIKRYLRIDFLKYYLVATEKNGILSNFIIYKFILICRLTAVVVVEHTRIVYTFFSNTAAVVSSTLVRGVNLWINIELITSKKSKTINTDRWINKYCLHKILSNDIQR